MICCCSLAGTSACKTCPNMLKSNIVNENSSIPITKTIQAIDFIQTIDPKDNLIYKKILIKTFYCEKCEGLIEEWQSYCPHCGAKLGDVKEECNMQE